MNPTLIEIYEDRQGNRPFLDWFYALRDVKTQARIESRLRRLSLGHRGDYKIVSGGILELRLPIGPGYRLYCSQLENRLILLLCGGDKRGQDRDIRKARDYWADYQERT